MGKRNYWIKLQKRFFDEKEIKKLRKIAGGDTFTIIYLKMLLLSLEENGYIYFEGVEETFISELALELDEDTENVALTIAFLQNHKLLELVNNSDCFMTQTPELVGSECDSARRVRKHRKSLALQSNNHVTLCNGDVTLCNTEKEKEREFRERVVDVDVDVDAETCANDNNGINIIHIENLCGRLSSIGQLELLEFAEKLPSDLIMYAVDIMQDNNKCSWAYLRSVLNNCVINNITAKEQLLAKEKEFRERKQQYKQAVKPERKVMSEEEEREFIEKIKRGEYT